MQMRGHEFSNGGIAIVALAAFSMVASACLPGLESSSHENRSDDTTQESVTTSSLEGDTGSGTVTAAPPTSNAFPPISFDGIPSNLALNATGEPVLRVQTALTAIGCGFLELDGEFGDGSERAERTLEADAKLPIDGKVDAAALGKIKEYYNAGNTHCGLTEHGTWAEAYDKAAKPKTDAGKDIGCEPGSNVYAVKLDDTDATAVSFTFDDGPHADHTPKFRAIMKGMGPATFFVIGGHAAAMPDVVKTSETEDFTIGNHTMTHDPNTVAAEIAPAQAAIAATGVPKPQYFRSPYYREGDDITRELEKAGLCNILTSPDAVMNDWPGSGLNQAKVAELQQRFIKATSNKGMGNFIVLHDGADSQETVEAALPGMLEYAKDHGIKIMGLQEMLKAGKPITAGPAIQDY